jgi:hypothetical protein
LRTRAPLKWPCAKEALKVGETRVRKLRESRQLIRCEEVPVPLLPGGGETLIPFHARLCQPQQRTIGDEEAHHFTVRRHLRMTSQEESAEREWPQLHFTHQETLAAAEEEHINLVKRSTIGTVTQWWRRVDRIACHLSTDREPANKKWSKCWRNGAVEAHRRANLQ